MRKKILAVIIGMMTMTMMTGCGLKEKIDDLNSSKEEKKKSEAVQEKEEYSEVNIEFDESDKKEAETVCERIDTRRYYYNQLSDESKKFYDEILKNKEKIMNNEKVIVDKISGENGLEYDYINEIASPVLTAIVLDNPETSNWLSGFCVQLSPNIIIENNKYLGIKDVDVVVEPIENDSYSDFASAEEIKQGMNEVEQVTKEFVKTIKDLSDEEKAKAIHDWILEGAEYDESVSLPHIRNTYGAIIQKKCVCAGFAYAYKYAADMAGLDTIIISGNGISPNDNMQSGPHAWNNVYVNGKWLLTDTTWDCNGESIWKEKKESYIDEKGRYVESTSFELTGTTYGNEYLLKPLEETVETHTPDQMFKVPTP